MNIKRHINRFRAWQRKPIQFSDQGLEEHCCANCGHTYSGNYCPVCGQKAGDKRITWRLVGQNFLKAWGFRLGGVVGWIILTLIYTYLQVLFLSKRRFFVMLLARCQGIVKKGFVD